MSEEQNVPQDIAQQAEDAAATAQQLDGWKQQLAADLGVNPEEMTHLVVAHIPQGQEDVQLTTLADNRPEGGGRG